MDIFKVWQWLAVLFGIGEVLLARINNILLYPAGIISSAISMYVLAHAGLYAECGLNGYYVIMSIYGWWHWSGKKNSPPVRISYCTRKEWWITLGFVVLAFLALAFILARYTPSSVPLWDAFVTATAWVGTWLLARRKIENWILLNISNAVAIPLLLYKQLPLFALLTAFLFGIALQGYFSWRKKIRHHASSVVGASG